MRYFIPDIAIMGGGFAVDSRAIAEGLNIPPVVNVVYTGGYYDAGDGGAGIYKRVVAQPAHEGYFQSGDGSYFELQHGDNNVLQFGAKLTGLEADSTINNTAIQNAIDFLNEGEALDFARGLIWYDGNIAVNTNRLHFTNGWLKKASGNEIDSFVFGTTISNVKRFTMSNFEMDGNKAAYAVGDVGSAIIAFYGEQFTFINCDLHDFPNDCVKAPNCSNFTFIGCTMTDTFNAGIELFSYPVDIRTNLAPDAGINVPALIGGFITVGSRFIGINDDGDGTLNGAGLIWGSSRYDPYGDGPQIVDMITVGNSFQNNLLGIWSENYGSVTDGGIVVGNTIRGAYPDSVIKHKNGVGVISGSNYAMVGNNIIDIGHHNPAVGNTVGLTVSFTEAGYESKFINVMGCNITDSLDAGNRMQYGINAQGFTDSHFGQVFLANASQLDYRIEDSNTSNVGVSGAIYSDGQASWIEPVSTLYTRDNIPADTGAVAFLPVANSAITDPVNTGLSGRLVGLQVTISEAIATGNVTFKVFIDGVDAGPNLHLTNADFAGGRIARVTIGTKDGYNVVPTDNVIVYATTDAAFGPITMDARATLYTDIAVLN